MRLNPHLHVVFLDGAYHEDGAKRLRLERAALTDEFRRLKAS
jgi:Putative transposase